MFALNPPGGIGLARYPGTMKLKTNFDEGDDSANPAMTSLAAATPGNAVIVSRIDATEPLAGRLADLGLLPDTPVAVVRRAPLGDPIEIELRGYRLCLRLREASQIQVRPLPVRPKQ